MKKAIYSPGEDSTIVEEAYGVKTDLQQGPNDADTGFALAMGDALRYEGDAQGDAQEAPQKKLSEMTLTEQLKYRGVVDATLYQ